MKNVDQDEKFQWILALNLERLLCKQEIRNTSNIYYLLNIGRNDMPFVVIKYIVGVVRNSYLRQNFLCPKINVNNHFSI